MTKLDSDFVETIQCDLHSIQYQFWTYVEPQLE